MKLFALAATTLLIGQSVDLEIGDRAAFRFRSPPLNACGVASLDDLRGKPVVVVYWGRETWGADQYVGDVLAWQKQWGDDLAIVFVESQGASELQVEAMVFGRGWTGNRAMWTTEPLVNTGLIGIPIFALLSNEGELLLKSVAGMAGMGLLPRKMEAYEDAIAHQVELRRKGPEGCPPSVAKAYKLFSKGDVAKALELAAALAESPTGKEPEKERQAAEVAAMEFRFRLEQRLTRAEWLFEHGYLVELREELGALDEELESQSDLKERVAKVAARLDSEEFLRERKGAEELEKVLKKIRGKGTNKKTPRSLKKIIRKYPNTMAARRAEHLTVLALMKII